MSEPVFTGSVEFVSGGPTGNTYSCEVNGISHLFSVNFETGEVVCSGDTPFTVRVSHSDMGEDCHPEVRDIEITEITISLEKPSEEPTYEEYPRVNIPRIDGINIYEEILTNGLARLQRIIDSQPTSVEMAETFLRLANAARTLGDGNQEEDYSNIDGTTINEIITKWKDKR